MDVAHIERMICGGPSEWGANSSNWRAFTAIFPVAGPLQADAGESGRIEFLTPDNKSSFAVGRQVVVMTADGILASPLVIDHQRVSATIDAPAVTTYERLVQEFDQAVARPDLATASLVQLEALRLIATPDWAQFRNLFVGDHGRSMRFLRGRGAKVAALYWTDEHRELLSAALLCADDMRPLDVDAVEKLARGIKTARAILLEEDEVAFSALSRRLAAEGITQAKTIVNLLTENREAYLDGKTVIGDPDPAMRPVLAVVPQFKAYWASRDDMSEEQARFYDEVAVPAFEAHEPLDLDGSITYGFIYLYDVIRKVTSDTARTRDALDWFSDTYSDSKLGVYASQWRADLSFAFGDFEEGVAIARRVGLGMRDFFALARHLDLRLTVTDVRSWLPSNTGLTPTGQAMREDVDAEMQHVLDEFHDAHGQSLIEHWRNTMLVDRDPGKPVPQVDEILLGVASQSDVESYIYWANHNDTRDAAQFDEPRAAFTSVFGVDVSIPWPDGYPVRMWNTNLILARLRAAYRLAENRVRQAKGLPPIGEGWVSEVALLEAVRDAFPAEKVQHQGRPAWLKPQSLDIYFPEHNVGIEYQGVQHSQPVKRFGGEEAFTKQQERDARKRELCARNGCVLVEVHPDYDKEAVLAQIAQALERPRSSSTPHV